MSSTWDEGFGKYMDGVSKVYPKNLNNNSGDPIGIALSQYTAIDGRRITASDAFLSNRPSNLTVTVESPVEKILFEGQRAIGVQLSGKKSR